MIRKEYPSQSEQPGFGELAASPYARLALFGELLAEEHGIVSSREPGTENERQQFSPIERSIEEWCGHNQRGVDPRISVHPIIGENRIEIDDRGRGRLSLLVELRSSTGLSVAYNGSRFYQIPSGVVLYQARTSALDLREPLMMPIFSREAYRSDLLRVESSNSRLLLESDERPLLLTKMLSAVRSEWPDRVEIFGLCKNIFAGPEAFAFDTSCGIWVSSPKLNERLGRIEIDSVRRLAPGAIGRQEK